MSVMILLFVTLIFSIVLWIAEHAANPDYSLWDALVWVVVKYVEDPADVVVPPVTVLGQIIGTLVGILGIAIFAVPAGLIGSGLLDTMAEERQQERTNDSCQLLHKRFRRITQPASFFVNEMGHKVALNYVPRYRTFPHIMMKCGMTSDEIVSAVNNSPDMRLMNTASTHSTESSAHDELVVVHFPLNNEYGCCLDRGSDVTIVAPVALSEMGTGSFAFSLAAMGGFNYVSKELSPNPDDPFGFYSMQKSKLGLIGDYDVKEDVESQALHFMHDLKSLKARSEEGGRTHWFIFLMATTKSVDNQLYMWRLASDSAEELPPHYVGDVRYGSTVTAHDEPMLQQLYGAVSEAMARYNVVVRGTSQSISVSLDNCSVLKSVTRSNIMCRLGGGVDCNALTMRLGYEILIHSSQHLIIAKEIADALKAIVEPDRVVPDDAARCYLTDGDSFADGYGETKVFERDSDKLRAMIARMSREARQRFEHLDLDGNEEESPKRTLFGRKSS